MTTCDTIFDVIIAGAGPAGTSSAIHLAQNGLSVLLVEQKTFPREKLCGEFISPECFDHFERLGVLSRMNSSEGSRLRETVFYSRAGRSVRVPSEWFGNYIPALGLSRAEMDHNLLHRAKEVGVVVIEGAQGISPVFENADCVQGIAVRSQDVTVEYNATITIDATGRARALARRTKSLRKPLRKASLVAFKTHLSGSRGVSDHCEIYFYRGGYGGLNAVEGGFSNLCFIVSAKDARRCQSDPDLLMREIVCENRRAAYTLKHATATSSWLAVTLEGFGFQSLSPSPGLLTAGDSAAFIDPFTGSGILMALQSGELIANCITKQFKARNFSFVSLINDYERDYHQLFDSRLRFCSWLRRAAFVPGLAEAAILIASSDRLRQLLTRATRTGRGRPRAISQATKLEH